MTEDVFLSCAMKEEVILKFNNTIMNSDWASIYRYLENAA